MVENKNKTMKSKKLVGTMNNKFGFGLGSGQQVFLKNHSMNKITSGMSGVGFRPPMASGKGFRP